MVVIDTDVAIHIRDGEPGTLARVQALGVGIAMSAVTRAELLSGLAIDPAQAAVRAARLEAMMPAIRVLAFDDDCALAYGRIVTRAGFSRRRVLDRMIAATALVHGLPLVTMNGHDFRDIDGLVLDIWPVSDSR